MQSCKHSYNSRNSFKVEKSYKMHSHQKWLVRSQQWKVKRVNLKFLQIFSKILEKKEIKIIWIYFMLINYLVKESVIIQPANLWTRKQSRTARLIKKNVEDFPKRWQANPVLPVKPTDFLEWRQRLLSELERPSAHPRRLSPKKNTAEFT